MRNIRSFHQLANRGFSSPFQRYQVTKTSRACLHLDIHECGRTYGTSASSDTLEARNIRKRVSMHERKSMVENYVNRYREMNAGKFPTATDIKKNVGGSHYSVRKILQELIHHSKMPLTDTKDSVSLEKSVINKAESCANPEVFRGKKPGRMGPISKVGLRDDISKSLKSKEGLQSSTSHQSNIAEHDGPQSHRLVNEPKICLQTDPEINIKHEAVHEDELSLNGLPPESEVEDVSERASHKVPTKDAEPPKNSSLWQNLRSFANGIFGIWKRS